jgi:ankyrin repeat protein
MLNGEYVEYLKRENKSNYEVFKNYYIKRKFKRFVRIDLKKLDQERVKNPGNFLIAHSRDEFKEKCQKFPKRNIHYLKFENNNQQLVWKRSQGNKISDLNECIIREKEFCLSIEEDKIFNHGENILIIAAEPGMGKSTILDAFTQCSNSKQFFIKIVLNNCTKTLSELKEKKLNLKDYDLLELLLSNLLRKTEKLELTLLKHFVQEEKLILMFDGLDEVVDYKEQVKSLIKALYKQYRFKKILLTTRNHLKMELEDYFKTISFSLNEFVADDQKDFLYKYWRRLNTKYKKNLRSKTLKDLAEKLILKVRGASLTEAISQLIGIPLQTKMIGDIFFGKLDSKEDFFDAKFGNIADLYERFIENKVKIQFEEKKKINIHRNKDDFEEQKEKFYEDHIKLSLVALFKHKQIDVDERAKKRILKYGLIDNFLSKSPIFLHQSFAEYFLAKSSFSKIEKNQDSDDNIELREILRESERFLIRRFLNDLMGDFKSLKQKDQESKRENYVTEIDNCCKENLINLLNYFLERKDANIKGKNEFLLCACIEGHREIVELLIEKGIDINQQDRWKFNALYKAAQMGHKEICAILISKGININQTDMLGYNALCVASQNGHKETVELLIDKGINVFQGGGLMGANALYMANQSRNYEIAELLKKVYRRKKLEHLFEKMVESIQNQLQEVKQNPSGNFEI